MGHVFADIEIVNSVDLALSKSGKVGQEEVRAYRLNILVDTGALMLTINETIQEVLGLPVIDHRMAQMADGSRIKLPVVGPIEVRFEDRFSTGNAYVLPGDSEPLLGVIPLEEMDVWINPTRNLLTPVHPEGWVLRLK
jgi:clan AA aspartic protease